jgi:hypothetical protein
MVGRQLSERSAQILISYFSRKMVKQWKDLGISD